MAGHRRGAVPTGPRRARRRRRARATRRSVLVLSVAGLAAVGALWAGVLPGGHRIGTLLAGPSPTPGFSAARSADPSAGAPTATPHATGGQIATAWHGTGPDPRQRHTSASPSSRHHPARSPSPSPRRTARSTAPSARHTTPAVTATADTGADAAVLAARSEVLREVNQQRATAGCSALSTDPKLTGLAQAYSEDMARRHFFSHTDPDGRTPWDRAKARGITNLGGENIAMGQPTAQAVMTAWMNSPGHRANILNCKYHSIGIGVQFGSGGPWWTQDFGF